jgi:hypothetical protein
MPTLPYPLSAKSFAAASIINRLLAEISSAFRTFKFSGIAILTSDSSSAAHRSVAIID